jgi:hypothetical protein
MLVFLQRWARKKNIRFLLFNPSESVQSALRCARFDCRILHPFIRGNDGPSRVCKQSICASCLSRQLHAAIRSVPCCNIPLFASGLHARINR